MRRYGSRPEQKRARMVWDYVSGLRGKEPTEIWKNSNCWMAGPTVYGNAWGWWIAYFRGDYHEYEPVDPKAI